MARTWHKILNRSLPMGVRVALRKAAGRSIPSLRHLDMPVRLRHVASLGLAPKVIFDIGAAQGEWSRLAHEIWPTATLVGFEPNASRIPLLDATRAEVPRFTYHRCFLGPTKGEVKYADQRDQTSLMMPSQNAEGTAVAPMCVLDELIAGGTVPSPDFLKLDVQGFELEVLKGGRQALAGAEVAVLEVSQYHLSPEQPTTREVLEFMWASGYVLYDLMGMLRRPSDDAMSQLDMMFLRSGHRLLRDTWD